MGPRGPGPAGPAVLVVEDEPGVAALLAEILAGAGYAPTTTDSALGAVALARRLRPAVVLLDLGLPYRSGGALLGDLKADPATAGIPVLVVSALADALPPDRRALTAGVLGKPFSPAALLAAVRPPPAGRRRPAPGGRRRGAVMPRPLPPDYFARAPFAGAGPELFASHTCLGCGRGRRRGPPSAPTGGGAPPGRRPWRPRPASGSSPRSWPPGLRAGARGRPATGTTGIRSSTPRRRPCGGWTRGSAPRPPRGPGARLGGGGAFPGDGRLTATPPAAPPPPAPWR